MSEDHVCPETERCEVCTERARREVEARKRRGLIRKFDVSRVDGRDEPGEKHHGCRYFVLDLDHDEYAGPALRAYAHACRHAYPALALDLYRHLAGETDVFACCDTPREPSP